MDKLKQKFADTVQHQILGDVVSPIIEKYPTLTPALMSSSLNIVKVANPPGISYEPMPYGIHFRYGITLGPAYDMEFGFPINLPWQPADTDGDAHNLEKAHQNRKFMEAMRVVVDLSDKYAKSK